MQRAACGDADSRLFRRAAETSTRAACGSPDRPDTPPERKSRVLFFVRILGESLLDLRRWQVWMRAFSISGRGVDRGPGGPDSLLDFLFGRGQRIVRDVQRALRYFRFDYAVQGFDRIGDFLLVDGISQFVDFNSSSHGFAQT